MNIQHRVSKRVIRRIPGVVVSIMLGLSLVQSGNSQTIVDPPRIGFEFKCPSHVLAPGQSMILRADVFGAEEVMGEERAKQLAYRWEIFGGTVTAGQGTPEVAITASDLRPPGINSIKVKVKLAGGPPELQKEMSCVLKIDPQCQAPALFENFGDIPWQAEQKILNRLGEHLTTGSPQSVAFLVVYAGQGSCVREARWRANRAKEYLLGRYKIGADRVIAIDGGFRDMVSVDLFIATKDSCGPFPNPNLLGSKANVFGSCAKKFNSCL